MVQLVRTALWKQPGYGSTGANRIPKALKHSLVKTLY
jgi:hypothetical protein